MDDLEHQKLEALAEFAAGAGHEINNPLAIISGYVQLLLQEIEHPEQRRRLGMIAAQVQRAYEMIADIRFFAQPPQPEWTTFNIAEELKILADEQAPLMAEAGVMFHTDIEHSTEAAPDNGLTIRSDPVLLHLAVNALCNNAREAVQLIGGTVWLALKRSEHEQKDAHWQISVRDDGFGILEPHRSRIFDPYYSGRQSGRGLGFGLPKAWRIMQLLGGSIRYEPAATFVLTLGTVQK